MPPKRNTGVPKKLPITNVSTDSEKLEDGFTMEEEVLWCIKKLEASLSSESITAKSLKSTVLALKTLKNSKAPVIKKRQVMRMSCGDYRKGMVDELKKAKIDSRKISLLPVKNTKVLHAKKQVDVCSELEKEASLSPEFTFNFPVPDGEELRLDFLQLNINTSNSS